MRRPRVRTSVTTNARSRLSYTLFADGDLLTEGIRRADAGRISTRRYDLWGSRPTVATVVAMAVPVVAALFVMPVYLWIFYICYAAVLGLILKRQSPSERGRERASG